MRLNIDKRKISLSPRDARPFEICSFDSLDFTTYGTSIGFRYALHRMGYRVLINEYTTSSSRPTSIGKHCVKRRSPSPWRTKHGEAWVHGLVQCNSPRCTSDCGGKIKRW